ncbi:Uncharacterised protein [Xylophilus ampelinus]|nr:hypothetical protein [Variovorax sp.]VTY33793.1 Uncharacterised protein [Xylophilus ampelinus]
MIVPAYWAEGRLRQRVDGRQITVRRFGWSDESQAAAQAHADQRTREAFERIVAGEALERRERKAGYNGAQGLPIREEIVERHGDAVVTRNSYGARCLNTPDVLFVDVDFDQPPVGSPLLVVVGAAALGGGVAGYAAKSWLAALVAFLGVLAVGLWRIRTEKANIGRSPRDPLQAVRTRIDRFIHQHPDWHLRLYRTPAGLRALAMHRTFSPGETAVADCFHALGADTVYARMCRNQNCFRARVSAKPWRIGIDEHLRPRPGVWPVAPDRLPEREAWVARYEAAAARHAACEFVAAVGATGRTTFETQSLCEVHDRLCRAESGLPIA